MLKKHEPHPVKSEERPKIQEVGCFVFFRTLCYFNWVSFLSTANGTLCASLHMHKEQKMIWKEMKLGFSCNLLVPGPGIL